jgi:hypothetical protein
VHFKIGVAFLHGERRCDATYRVEHSIIAHTAHWCLYKVRAAVVAFAKLNARASWIVTTTAALRPAWPPDSRHRQILPGVDLGGTALTPRAAFTSACVSNEHASGGALNKTHGTEHTSIRHATQARMAEYCIDIVTSTLPEHNQYKYDRARVYAVTIVTS